LLAESAADAPWRKSLETEIASAAAPGPTPEQMAAAQAMNAEDQRRMIQTMVDSLEEKLKADGSDIAGWQRLIRARMVLGQREQAKVAYRAARELFKDKSDVLASFEGLAKELGVE
jgi:cytochrome c-type biogenesis protein CcmH